MVISEFITLFYWLLQRNGLVVIYGMENLILNMDNFAFTENGMVKSKIIHIRGKIIYSFSSVNQLILQSDRSGNSNLSGG
jgi:hypothetical protein